ncbi:MAG: hypothetical protein A2Y80_06700 [Deltaproteobacteria bacterium RBG_13_58_19]|nr:MAG: hypothetical protein A2Y80_06700 [Deltaproteobacteria bacterium RBG_13_58_19]
MLPKVSFYQIILAVVAIAFLYSGLVKFIRQEKKQTLIKLLATILIWGSVLLFAVYPRLPHIISRDLGFGQNLNTLIFVGFVVVLMIIFKLLTIIERLERDISEIVRKEALKKLSNGTLE